MALRLRKDIKKSSYYVWFLGAKESKGLRGSEYIIPVIRHLEEREKDVEPFKVTLQVSHKGLKIVQNIVSQGPKSSKPKNETIKHFIPHNTITYVHQHEDIISCILLLFNPVTKCPLHVHAYRCDSLETASHLKQQLQILIDRPENQKKMAEIENRLKPVEKLKKLESSIGSDTGASTRESESSEERFALENTRISTLYDSVAAELRAKLGKKNSPILLPPRDYDTVHRQKGNLTGIELRRCLNANIVGQNVKNKRLESSGGSSGIGSDHPPSPDSPETPESRFHTLETHSTSDDEDWNTNPTDSALYLMHSPRPNKTPDSGLDAKPYREKLTKYVHDDLKYSKSLDDDYRKSLVSQNMSKYLEKPIAKFTDNKYLQRQKSLKEEEEVSRRKSLERSAMNRKPSKPAQYFEDDGFDEETRNRSFSYEEEVFYEEKRPLQVKSRQRISSEESRSKFNPNDPRYYEPRSATKVQRDSDAPNDPRYYEPRSPTRVSRDSDTPSDPRYYEPRSPTKVQRDSDAPNDPRYYEPRSPTKVQRDSDAPNDPRYYEPRSPPRVQRDSEEFDNGKRYYYEDATNSINRRHAQFRQRSPTPDDVKAPRDRFKDAKEKFLLMEKERVEQERRNPEPPISPTIQRDKIHFIKRHQSMAYPSKEHLRSKYTEDRFANERSDFSEEIRPKPAPRYNHEEVRYRQKERDGFQRTSDKYEPKRRSMFSLIEEEHKKNSNEIAKELKRRSYVDFDHPSYQDDQVTDFSRPDDHQRDIRNSRHYQELPEADRYNALMDQKYTKNPQKSFKSIPGYRHSYAEPKMKIEPKKKNVADLLQRTNSSVGYLQQRVGMAGMHPY